MYAVIHIIVGLDIGGAEMFLKRLVKECSKDNNVRQLVISMRGFGSLGKEINDRENGVRVVSLDMHSKLDLPKAFIRLIGILKKNRSDAIFTWMYHSDLIGGLASFIVGKRNIYWGIRGTEIPQSRFSTTSIIIRICRLLSFYIPRGIICNSTAGMASHQKLGYCKNKFMVIHNGFNLDQFQPDISLRAKVRESLGISEGEDVIGIVARYDPLKDFNNFVDAASQVIAVKPKTKFLMVGEGLTENNMDLVKAIESTGNKNHFILKGRNDTRTFLSAMDIFCLSSKSEGFPNVVAEAMAMEIPCVVTEAGDAPLIVSEYGKVVPIKNSKKLAGSLIDMIELPSKERYLIGKKARASIMKRFSIEKASKEYLKIIKQK